jgi:hypothetical protein
MPAAALSQDSNEKASVRRADLNLRLTCQHPFSVKLQYNMSLLDSDLDSVEVTVESKGRLLRRNILEYNTTEAHLNGLSHSTTYNICLLNTWDNNSESFCQVSLNLHHMNNYHIHEASIQ